MENGRFTFEGSLTDARGVCATGLLEAEEDEGVAVPACRVVAEDEPGAGVGWDAAASLCTLDALSGEKAEIFMILPDTSK